MASLDLLVYLIVLCRVSGFLLTAPIFSSKQIPMQLRLGICLILTIVIAMTQQPIINLQISNSLHYILILATEILIGYAIGLIAYLISIAIQTAGQLIDMTIGFAMVNVLDTQSGIQIPLIGNFLYTISLLIFLCINGHHFLISALSQSYNMIPITGAMVFDGQFAMWLMKTVAQMFFIAVKIAIPIVFSMLIADLALGFLARVVPQMNIFIIGFPAKITGGLVLLLVMMPTFGWFIQNMFEQWYIIIDQSMKVLGA